MNQSLRILLWDLDGTLVRGKRFGTFKDYTAPMLESVFGTSGCLRDMVVSGMTDLQIVEEALRGEGITREHIYFRKDELRRCYLEEMKRAVTTGAHVIEPIPGGREALQAVAEHPRYASALLTGNIEPAAHFKVEVAGLAEFFTLPGAFGDESFDRRDLPELAARRINEYLAADLKPEEFIVIGDRKSTRLNSSHLVISYAVFCLKKKNRRDLVLHGGTAVVDPLARLDARRDDAVAQLAIDSRVVVSVLAVHVVCDVELVAHDHRF